MWANNWAQRPGVYFNCCAQLKSSIKHLWCNWIAANFVKWVWQAGDGEGIPWRFYCLELLQVKQQLQMERGFLLWLMNSTAVYFGGPCTFLWSWTCHWIASETIALFLTFYQKYPQLLLVRHTQKTISCFFKSRWVCFFQEKDFILLHSSVWLKTVLKIIFGCF